MAFFLSQELTLTSDAAVKDKDQAQCATRAEWSSYAEPMLLAVALEVDAHNERSHISPFRNSRIQEAGKRITFACLRMHRILRTEVLVCI